MASVTNHRSSGGLSATYLFALLLLIIVIVFITPYLFSLFAAFKPLGDILSQSPARPPTNPTWANFKEIPPVLVARCRLAFGQESLMVSL